MIARHIARAVAVALIAVLLATPAFAIERKMACVLMKSGTAWVVLNNAAHNPIGCASVVRSEILPGVFGLRLNYTFTAAKVNALIVGSDETWAGVYHAGASVGLYFANIYIKDSNGILVDPNDVPADGNLFVIGWFE